MKHQMSFYIHSEHNVAHFKMYLKAKQLTLSIKVVSNTHLSQASKVPALKDSTLYFSSCTVSCDETQTPKDHNVLNNFSLKTKCTN